MTDGVFKVLGKPDPDRAGRTKRLKEMGFGWADLEGEPYWIDQIVVMGRQTYAELERASRQLWRILDKTARYIIGKRDLYALLGIPPVLWQPLDQQPIPPEGLISRYSRFDFAISNGGQIRLLELNADTPTGYVEASVATPWLCSLSGIESPNGHMRDLVSAAWREDRPELAACVAYGTHQEDSGTLEALVHHSGLNIRCADCLDLWVDNGVLKDREGRIVNRLFALYPKEWMAFDDGGEALAYAIEAGNLQLFNPVHSILLQSKGLQAAAWGLYELGLLFDAEERDAIGRYMLPTYNKPVFEGSYVSKSMFGREGGSVKMYDTRGQLEIQDKDSFDTSSLFPVVYQKRADLAHISTAAGEFHLLTGMFMINGAPCGLLGRAGGPITGNSSHFIALGVK
jgi:glutathionylspermidine synthase